LANENIPPTRFFAFGSSESVWQNIPADEYDFEELALKACSLIVKGDVRIGKIPKQKKKKARKKA